MEYAIITRPGAPRLLVVNDSGSFNYFVERSDVQARKYWEPVDPSDRDRLPSVLDVLNELAFGDATSQTGTI